MAYQFIHNRAKGDEGENIACKYLVNRGYSIIKRNYRKSWGEIDIIGQKDKIFHFFEVKSVFVDSFFDQMKHKPEENVHGLKIRHIRRVIQTYLEESKIGFEAEFSFHVLCVYMDNKRRVARIIMLENLIL